MCTHRCHGPRLGCLEVWAFQSDTGGWQKLCEGGPAPAGHVAAVDRDSQRLLLCFGVNRSPPGP